VLVLRLQTDSSTEFSSGGCSGYTAPVDSHLSLLVAVGDWTAETVDDRQKTPLLVSLMAMTVPIICQVKEQTKKFLAK